MDPLANLMTLPDLKNIGDSSQPLTREMPEVNQGTNINDVTPIYTPYIPNGTPDAVNINDHIVGNEETGPNPGLKQNSGGTLGYVNSVNKFVSQADSWAKDPYKYGRAYSYGAGWKNANFERYYSSPQFKNLGFSPYRNNEAVYNEKSSWWDDFNRMRGQWLGLAWNGVKSAGVGELFGGADESSDSFEKAMAIGSTSKTGTGAFLTNLTLNSAYTLGIMGEIAVENLALSALDGLTFGGSAPLHAAAIAKEAASAGKLFEGVKGTYDFLKELKNVEKAKDFFTAAKAGETATKFAKWINPLEHTTEFVTHLAKNTSSFDKLGSLAKTTKGFSSFYKDLREIELAHSEAKMEGATGAHKYHDQLIDEYYNEHGQMPDDKEAQKIFDRSQSIRTSITLANDFVIYGSNKLTIGKLLDGFPSASFVAKGMEEASARNLTKVAAKEVLGKGAYELTEPTFAKKAVSFLTSSAYVPWSRTYLAGNIAEALQENAQDVIQDYQKARHDKIDKDPSQAGYWIGVNDLGAAMGKQWSGQGLDTFMSGLLMGAIAGGAQGAIMGGIQKVQQFKNKEQFEQAKTRHQENENAIVNAVNSLAKDGINYGQHNAERVATVKNLADEQDKAAAEADPYKFNSVKDELATEHFHTLESNGKMKLFTDHIDDMLKLQDSELADAYNKPGTEATEVRKRLNELKTRAEQYSADYKSLNEEFVNPNNPSMFNPKKNPELYQEVLDNYNAHNEAVKQLLFSVTAATRVAGRMTNIIGDVTGNSSWLRSTKGVNSIGNTTGADVSLLLDQYQRSQEILTLKDEIEALEGGNKEQKAQAKIKQERLDQLQHWSGVLANFNSEIQSNTKALSPEQIQANVNKSKVREGAVVKFEGKEEEYKVKKIVGNSAIVEDKDGKTITVDRTKVQIVKESSKPSEHVEGDTLSEATQMLKDGFMAYTQHLAKVNGGVIMDKQLEAAFNKVKDFYLLERDSQNFVQAINYLSNPEYFNRYANIAKANQKMRDEQHAESMKESFNKFVKLADDNKFLGDLMDIGVFIMPNSVEIYKVRPRDVTFYDVPNKEVVKKDSDKYKEILKVVEKYEKTVGIVPAETKVETPETKPGEVTPAKAAPEKKETIAPKAGVPITPSTSVDEIFTLTGLKKPLIEAYKKEGRVRAKGEKPFEMLGGTDKEIMATATFKEFLNSGTAIKIINQYNVETGRVKEAAPVKEVPVKAKTTTDWSSLIESSTSEKELDKVMDQIDKAGAMSPELLGSINMKRESLTKTTTATPETPVDRKTEIEKEIESIENKIKSLYYFIGGTDSYAATVQAEKDIKSYEADIKKLKEELAALEEQPAVKTEPGVQAEISFEETPVEEVLVPEFMAEEFANVTTVEELKKLIFEKSIDPKLNLSSDYVTDLENRLTAELMKRVNFDQVENNTIVLDKDGNAFLVTKKTKNQIKLRSFDLSTMTLGEEEKTVNKKEFNNKIELIYSKGMENYDISKKVTAQETEESKNLIKDLASNSETEESGKKIFEAGKVINQEEIDNKFKNASKNCK